jgi:hypothetical protein
MLLLLHLISLCSLAFGQFYNAHPMMASGGLGYSPGSSGDSETLPISQDELAQLMAQSLASSPRGFGHESSGGYPPQREVGPSADEGVSNYDGGEDGGNDSGFAPNQPEEYSNDGQYGQQDSSEGSPYQQQQGSHGEQDDSPYQQPQEPQQSYRDKSGYKGGAPSYREGGHYQSGRYSPSSSYGPQTPHGSHQESNPGSYDASGQSGSHYGPHSSSNGYSPRGHSYSQSSYNPNSEYQSNSPNSEYDGSAAAGPHGSHYSQDSDSGYASPGSGYAGHGSESFLSYDIRRSPKKQHHQD